MSENALITQESAKTESINDRIDRINTLARRNEACNYKRTLSLAKKALALSKKCGYEKGWANSLVSMGIAYGRMSEFDKAMVCAFEAIPMLQKLGDKQDEVRAFNIVGSNYFFNGRLEESLNCLNKSMGIAVENGLDQLAGTISSNIGEIYNEMNKWEEAAEYYKLGFKTALRTKDLNLKATSLANLGQVYFKLECCPEALRYYRRGLAVFRRVNEHIYFAHTLNQIGEVYHHMGLVNKAMDFYTKSLEKFAQQSDRFYQTDVRVNLGLLYMDNEQYDRACESFKTALSIAESISANKKVYLIHKYLSKLYEKTGDYESALHHYKLHHMIEADVSNEQLERQLYIAKMEYRIEQAQKQAELVSAKNNEMCKKTEEVQKNARELEESYKNINVIGEIGQKITSTFSFSRIADTIHKSLNSLMDAAVFSIILYNDTQRTLEYKVCIDRNEKLNIGSMSIDNPSSLSAWCIKNCKEICLDDVVSEHTRYVQKYEKADDPDQPKSAMYYPLMIDKKVVGVITVQSYKNNAYTQNNVKTMKALASYIAISLNNYRKSQEIKGKAAELKAVNSHLSVEISKRKAAQKNLEEVNKKLEDLLSMDALTGVFNRRGFEQFLRLEWRRSVRSGIPLSIILIDIDFFKGYNDKYGHVAGDECLKKVSKALMSNIMRPMDFLARYGGEEFIVILPNTAAEGALNVAEVLRKSVEDLNITHGRSSVSPYITISLGVSTVTPDRRNSRKDFINSADRALYRAKQEGRNRVCQFVHN